MFRIESNNTAYPSVDAQPRADLAQRLADTVRGTSAGPRYIVVGGVSLQPTSQGGLGATKGTVLHRVGSWNAGAVDPDIKGASLRPNGRPGAVWSAQRTEDGAASDYRSLEEAIEALL